MDNNLSFHLTLSKQNNPQTDDKSWDKVLEAYKTANYAGVIRGILDYVDLNIVKKNSNLDQTEFHIPHGSVLLNLQITATHFKVKSPFLDISESKKIPLMRKVTELNFSPLNLSSIVLKGNQLEFSFECELILCEPYKIYDALKEICVYADSFDDEFITKFNAKWISEPKITPFTKEDKDIAWNTMQLYLSEANESISYYETKRLFSFAWDILAITLMKLEYFFKPQGLLRNEIEKTVSYILGDPDPINTKLSRGKSFLEKLSQYDRLRFENDLYSVSTFIPYKARSDNQSVKVNAESAYIEAKKAREMNDHLSATMTLMFHFFSLFYNNNLPKGITDMIENGLIAASKQPWSIASDKLFDTIEKVMNGNLDIEPQKKKGFLRKLFGG